MSGDEPVRALQVVGPPEGLCDPVTGVCVLPPAQAEAPDEVAGPPAARTPAPHSDDLR